ncbi:MAG: hypothetical protein IIB61_02785, partial [Planctomycetes bacterium]|nr:hypothetical protein [Planctomycetota bacterium]
FEKRIEEGLQSLERRLDKAKKKPDRSQVERQIGRLLGRNSRAAGLFDIKVSDVERGGADGFLKVTWTKKDAWREWASLSEGCYLLRTNLVDWTAEDLWKTYIQLTQAEAAFRTQKSELNLRPSGITRKTECRPISCSRSWPTPCGRCSSCGCLAVAWATGRVR